MRLLLPKNLSLLSSPSSPARALLLRLHLYHSSSSSSPPPAYHYARRSEEETRNVRVSVWWDFENCSVPAGVNVVKVAPAVTEAVRANGIRGPVQITAFGDVLRLSRSNQEALHDTGILFAHVSHGGKNSADRSLLVELLYWVSQNPPPAHIFLISGDKDFAGILHRLRMNNYNILLATPEKAPYVLCNASTIMWQWSSLIKGEDLTGKHFNHPPDGRFCSWYGSYKVPLENPSSGNGNGHSASLPNGQSLANGESASLPNMQICEPTRGSKSSDNGQSASLSNAKTCEPTRESKFSANGQSASLSNAKTCEPAPESKPGTVPKSVVRQVRHILSSHPKGITITALRAELSQHNVCLDKALYGYKRFSSFLLSMSLIQLKPLGDGNFLVRLSPSKSPKPFANNDGPSAKSAVKNEEGGHATVPKLTGVGMASEKAGDVVDTQLSETQLPLKDNTKVLKSKVDFLKTSSKMSHDNEIVRPDAVSPNISGKYASENHFVANDYTMVETGHIESDKSGKFIAEDKYEMPTRKNVDEVCDSSYSLPVDDSVVDKKPGGSAETYSKTPTFFERIRSWWPFWKRSAKSDDLTTHQTKVVSHSVESELSQPDKTVSHSKEPKLSEPNQTVSQAVEPKLSDEVPKLSEPNQSVGHSEKLELFSRVSFWNDMESFVATPKGSLLFNLSTSREDLVHNLQKDGPWVLGSLAEKDILQLVDLLIVDKKWLEESPSQAYPFRLIQPVQKSPLAGISHGANGLRSLFLSRTSQQKPFEHDMEEHNQNIPHTGASAPAPEAKHDERSRNDILADCQKLVNEKLREHPEGFNLGCVRKDFVTRYGYNLDLQKLGHKKLASLIETMPGVKLESTYIVPSTPAVCDSNQETPILKTQVTNASDAVSNSDSELFDSAPNDNHDDSPWEELGPVSSVNKCSQSDLESQLSRKAKEFGTTTYHPDYEPAGLYCTSSDSEGDSPYSTQLEKLEKPNFTEQDSSIWQTLDSYHSGKEGENSVKKSDSEDILGNALAHMISSSADSAQGTISKPPSGRGKQRSRKNYSFVADPLLPEKEKLIAGGILDCFRKADESKMQN